VLRPGVDLELLEQVLAQRVLGQHAPHGALDDPLRPPGDLLGEGGLAQPPGVAAVPVVLLLLELAPGNADPGGVDDDDEVAAVQVGRKGRLVLAPQPAGDDARQPAEGLAIGVHDPPTALGCRPRRRISPHL
jgi:hypothetical protein